MIHSRRLLCAGCGRSQPDSLGERLGALTARAGLHVLTLWQLAGRRSLSWPVKQLCFTHLEEVKDKLENASKK